MDCAALGVSAKPRPVVVARAASLTMLETYKRKRDFSRTPEPPAGRRSSGNLRFVVQKHAARRLHYDFRLEIDGVLKSWPVPKGPSLDPNEKRLAVMVEDHPMDYATFEGVIAHGNYGAGQVIVWDSGVYSPDEGGVLWFGNREEADERMREGLEAGKLSFTLRGRKLRGSWTLVRTSRSPKDWLLIKHRDRYADPDCDVLMDDRSVQSGLTIEELKAGRLPDLSSRAVPGRTPAKTRQAGETGKKAAFPSKIKPMLARLVDEPFSRSGWLFEPKLDGFRAIAFLRQGDVRLRSRTGIDLTERFPELVDELATQPEDEMVLDGEIVALDDRGLPDFGLLQNSIDLPERARISRRKDIAAEIVYYVFDLLYLNGMSLQGTPLHERKALLARSVLAEDRVRVVEYVEREGEALFKASVDLGLEGIVAKRRDAVYEPGVRNASWLKIKGESSQEFVVGGFTAGQGSRAGTFGALVLGYYEGAELRYAGRVGSGFDQSILETLRGLLDARREEASPFAEDAELDKLDPEWVRPDLVVRAKFSQWTHENRLRAPVFLGLQPEVDPKSVGRETPDATVSVDLAGAESPEEIGQTEVADVLDQLSGEGEKLLLEVDGHRIGLTNLNKVFWPATDGRSEVLKRDMIAYYVRMGAVILPHLRDRPLTLTRYPDGIDGGSFYQKHWEHTLPEFVDTVRLYSSHKEGDQEYLLVNNLPTLVWLAQIADIELHPWLSRTVPGARRAAPDDRLHRLRLGDPKERAEPPRCHSVRPGPLYLLREGEVGGRARAEPPCLLANGGRGAGPQGHSGPAVALVLRQDVRKDRPPHLRPGPEGVRLQGHAKDLRAGGPLSDAEPSPQRHHGVVGGQARRQDLSRPQPERPRQEYGRHLLPQAASQRPRFDARALGRAGRRVSNGLHDRYRAGPGRDPGGPVGGHRRGEARPRPTAGVGGVTDGVKVFDKLGAKGGGNPGLKSGVSVADHAV